MASRKLKKGRMVDAAPSEGLFDKKQYVNLWAKPANGQPNRYLHLTEKEARRMHMRLGEALEAIDREREEDRFGRNHAGRSA